jgi:hypothetical protein
VAVADPRQDVAAIDRVLGAFRIAPHPGNAT